MFLNVDHVDAEQMSSGRLFQVTGPGAQNAWFPSCSLDAFHFPQPVQVIAEQWSHMMATVATQYNSR